jgi:signal transduction histidine kinase
VEGTLQLAGIRSGRKAHLGLASGSWESAAALPRARETEQQPIVRGLREGLTRRTVAASAVLVLVIGAAFAVLVLAIAELRRTTQRSTTSQEVLSVADTLERLVIDLETGARGYIITGDERFLAPWEVARAAVPRQSSELERLATGTVQHARAQRIATAVASYLRDYSVPLVDAVRRHETTGRSLAMTADGKRRLDLIRDEFAHFVTAETGLSRTRQDRADAAARRAAIAVTAGLAGSILLVLLYAGDIVRSLVRPVVGLAAMAGRLAGGDLAVRTLENGTGEIGALQRSFNDMARSLEASRGDLDLLAEEQSALRRVATLVARGDSPSDVFAAVVTEVCRLLGADIASLFRYEPGDTATVVAAHSESGVEMAVGTGAAVGGENVVTMVFRTGRAARLDGAVRGSGPLAGLGTGQEFHTRIGAPIAVAGRLWGAMACAWSAPDRMPIGVEGRVKEFTELVATAVANADGRAQLTASRARIVAAADDARRRIERDLHDGTQQRLVSLALELRGAEATVRPEQEELRAQLAQVARGLAAATQDLQRISRGIHPAILSQGGLGPALKTLARRSPVPVELNVRTDRRLPQPAEVAAYYVVSEALTNAVKHARASTVHVDVTARDALVELSIRDDGVGGADAGRGSGLIGLADRVEALGGELEIASPAGSGTILNVKIPIEAS